MDLSFSVELDIPPLLGELSGKKVLESWQEHADELADMEQLSVRDRTPRLTGALQMSVAAKANVSYNTLAMIYFDDGPQLDTWHRIYCDYQEGPPLGKATYTNGPRQPLARADPEDLAQIEMWATMYARRWADGLGG